jgi:macrodomain Ter protein organizer (MatP/YcbG family)
MPRKGWDNPRDPLDPNPKTGLFSERQFGNDKINKLLKQGKDPSKSLQRIMDKMSPADRRKMEKRIRDCKHKFRQQKPGRDNDWLH